MNPFEALLQFVAADDRLEVARMLGHERQAFAQQFVDPGNCSAVQRLLGAIRSIEMADVLVTHGLTPERVGECWAPGFGLNQISTLVAEHFIERGAKITAHAAAAMGLVPRLRALLDRQRELVHAKGGDGGRPLHFSRNLDTARLLVERGAELDPRDDDHDSTPAQWRISDAPEVTRFLLERGARPDIFLAAALNDLPLAHTLLKENPACVTYRIGHNSGPFPGIGYQGRGGTIYQWTLGFNQSPHEIAWHRGHREMFELLTSRSPIRTQLLVACMLVDRATAERLVHTHPSLMAELNDEDLALLAKCCWETNLNREAVRLMLDVGFPVDVPERNHGFLPLHNAAWCGDAALVELLLQRGHPVDRRDPGHNATALGYAIHSCVVAQRHPNGDFPRVVELLLAAGVPLDENQRTTGHAGIDAVLKPIR